MEISGEITDLSERGFGVLRTGERLWFVPGTWPGDTGVFRPMEVPGGRGGGRYGYAEIIRIDAPSPDRRTPACPHHGTGPGQCGGCPWMQGAYASQLRHKEHRVRWALRRVGLDQDLVSPIIPSPQQWGYRSRVQFKTDGRRLGYSDRDGRGISSISRCPVLDDTLQKRLRELQDSLPRPGWAPDGDHDRCFIELDSLVPGEPVVNQRLAFSQANHLQNRRIRHWLAQQLDSLSREGPVLELFAGSGNLTGVISAAGFPDILAAEVSPRATCDQRRQQLAGVTPLETDLYRRGAIRTLREAAGPARLLVANPPRAGLKKLTVLGHSLPSLQTILYVSCNPVTLAADLRRLMRSGFLPVIVQPLDQMPHTPHVEILVRLNRTG